MTASTPAPRPDGRRRLLRVSIAAAALLVIAAAGSLLQASLRWRAPETPAAAAGPALPGETGVPGHVVASQGIAADGGPSVLVTWAWTDQAAVGFEVLRDDAVAGSVPVSGDRWDDLAWRDEDAAPGATHRYQVRALHADSSRGPASAAFTLRVRSDADLGGRVFDVDRFPGDDRARLQAAVDAASAAGGGVVRLAARTYTLAGPVEVAGDRVLLRGAGRDATFVQPGFDGADDACGQATSMLRFSGDLEGLDGVRLTRPIAIGDRSAAVGSTAGLAVGQVIVFDQMNDQIEPSWFAERGIPQDPGSGQDRRYAWDANEITAINGGQVEFRYPFSQPFTTAVEWQWLRRGSHNGMESLTVQGRGPGEATYQRLIDVDYQAHFNAVDLAGRWANMSYARVRGYDVNVVGFRDGGGGELGYTEGSCKYRFSVLRAANFTFVDGVMGTPEHDRNQSFLTFQFAQRVLVRHSRFYGSRTYAINEHGGGSRDHVYENNYLATGPNSKGAVFLGNPRWGFGGPAIVRNNRFEGNYRDLLMFDHPYEVRFVDNRSTGCVNQCVLWSGWGGTHGGYAPIPDEDLWGSARLTIARNWMTGANVGLHLGYAYSGNYAYTGIKDAVITGNHIEAAEQAIRLFGDQAATRRVYVTGNTGSARYTRPEPGPGVVWAGNADADVQELGDQPLSALGPPADLGWTSLTEGWELEHTSA